jgi:hypothetical protein
MIKQLEFNIFYSRFIKSIFHTTAFLLMILLLCGPSQALDTTNTKTAEDSCDQSKKQSCENLVQDNILWDAEHPDAPYAKHWLQKNLDDLCSCTADPYATVNCFQVQVNNKRKTWQEAIAICRTNP